MHTERRDDDDSHHSTHGSRRLATSQALREQESENARESREGGKQLGSAESALARPMTLSSNTFVKTPYFQTPCRTQWRSLHARSNRTKEKIFLSQPAEK